MAPLEIKPYAEFEKRERFDTLLVEISTLFINLPVDQIDSKISKTPCAVSVNFSILTAPHSGKSLNKSPGHCS